jgi:hypothetical protein
MAKTSTTLSSAVTVNDTSIVVASATGVSVGALVVVDAEVMQVTKGWSSGTTIPVLRGRDGTATAAHKSAASVTFMLASDLPTPLAPQAFVQYQTQKPNIRTSYSAAGAITLPAPGTDATAVLNGTAALAMTIASPTVDMDGSVLTIVNNGKAAHTVTYTTGLGNNTTAANADVITWFATEAQGLILVATGGFWLATGTVAGAATLAGPGIG